MIIKFDLSTLPNHIQENNIKNAELSLYNAAKTKSNDESDSVVVKVLSKTWNETEATWHKASSSANWTTPGGDFPAEILYKRVYSVNDAWETYDVTAAIKTFVKTPSANNGFIIAAMQDFNGVTNSSTPHRFYLSSQYNNQSLRPKLSVTYNADSDINYFTPPTLLSKNIALQVSAERVKFLIPLKGRYTIAVSDIKGRQICSFSGCNESSYQVPASKLSNGMHIISIRTEGIKASARFLFIK